MSPSWRESLSLEIGAGELRLARHGRGLRPALRAAAAVPLTGRVSMAAAIDAAIGQLEPVGDSNGPSGIRGLRTGIVVSSAWVRFALTRGAAGLRGAAELKAAAAHTLAHVYGDAAAAWHVCASRSGADTLLAAGIEAALLDEVVAVLGQRGLRAVSCVPLFSVALNRLRGELQGPSWVVVVEPTRAVLALVDDGEVRALRTHRIDAVSPIDLGHWIDQCRLQDGIATDGAAVVVASYGGPAIDAARTALPVRFVGVGDDASATPRAS